jgi:hypothetical protein
MCCSKTPLRRSVQAASGMLAEGPAAAARDIEEPLAAGSSRQAAGGEKRRAIEGAAGSLASSRRLHNKLRCRKPAKPPAACGRRRPASSLHPSRAAIDSYSPAKACCLCPPRQPVASGPAGGTPVWKAGRINRVETEGAATGLRVFLPISSHREKISY